MDEVLSGVSGQCHQPSRFLALILAELRRLGEQARDVVADVPGVGGSSASSLAAGAPDPADALIVNERFAERVSLATSGCKRSTLACMAHASVQLRPPAAVIPWL